MGTAFDFMPLLLSNRSVQAEGHGQHRYSKTLKCASRPQGLTKGPWDSQWGSPDQYLPWLRPGELHSPSRAALLPGLGARGFCGGLVRLPHGGHPSRASCSSTEMLVSCSVFKAEAFLSWEHLPQWRGRGKKPWIFHVNSSDTVNLLFQEIPFPDLTWHFHSPTSFTKIYISPLFFSHANHVHNGFDYIVMK